MARFSDEMINRLKEEVSLIRLVESSGVELKPHGKDRIGHCPFHNDKTPSLVISPDSNLWNCLGACQIGGSVIDWVMKSQGISFRHAVELLKNDTPLLAAQKASGEPVQKSTTKKLDVLLSEDGEAQQLLNQVTQFYHDTLLKSPDALRYLENRGLGDNALIKHFRLGYANRTLGYRLPEKNRKAGKAMRGKLQEIGLLRTSGHEHFSGSIVVPMFDGSHQNVVELYGRKVLGAKLRKGTPQHMYLPGPHAGVWNLEGLQGQSEIILCEALIDAMTFWVNGYRNVTASYGTSGFTADHLTAFKACGVERILIAYDRDEAGNNAAEKLTRSLAKEGLACYRILFPKNMDANQYALEVQPSSKSLGIVIRSAEYMGTDKPPERQLSIELPLDQADFVEDGRRGKDEKTVIREEESPSLVANSASTTFSVDPATLPPAQALPDTPADPTKAEVSDKEISFTFGDRHYRVRGLNKNKNYELLKINLLANHEGNLHVDTFDIYSAKHRQSFIKVAALELAQEDNVIKKDVGKILLKLEELQEQMITKSIEQVSVKTPLSEDEQSQALELLRDPNLLDRILADFTACGVVGEDVNKLVGYLAAGSRKLERPLAVIIQSTSAAGKSALMDAVLNLMPEDERVQYSAMTGQSLFYMGETNLKNKILAIAEEEGASNASYALKLLQSEGVITIASTGKDDNTGDLVTKEYRVEGPVMLFLTTTAIDIDEELLNRCLVLTVNESREQTRAIHEAQRARRTLKGLQGKLEKERLVTLHRNAQSLIRSLTVINPYADQLTFLDDKTRTRRDHEKYLTLIDSIALLHQYQRKVKTLNSSDNSLDNKTGKHIDYIEVELSDIETANRLAHEVLGRSLDELPPQTRKLLTLIQDRVKEECKANNLEQSDYRFSRREIREVICWGNTQLKVHLGRLEEMEYLLAHRGSRGQSYQYELLYDQDEDDSKPRMMGLIDVEKLSYDEKKSGVNGEKSPPGRGLVGGWSADEKAPEPLNGKALVESGLVLPESPIAAKNKKAAHRNAVLA